MKTITPFFLVIFLVLFSACEEKVKTVPEKEQQPKVSKDTVSPKVNSHEKNIEKNTFDVEKYAEKILENKVYPSDNDETFNYLDTFLKFNSDELDLHFKVFRVIVQKSGGALAEVMGQYIFSFIKRRPNYFLKEYATFNKKEQKQWIHHLAYEFYFNEDSVTVIEDEFNRILDFIPSHPEKIEMFNLKNEIIKETQNSIIDTDATSYQDNLTSKLKEKVSRLAALKYNYQLKSLDTVVSKKTILLGGLKRLIKLRDTVYKDIDFTIFEKETHQMSTSFLKGTKPMPQTTNLYPRVTVEEYIFKLLKVLKTH